MNVTLPIGIAKDGSVYREVVLSEPTGALLRKVRDHMSNNNRTDMYMDTLSAVVEDVVGLGKPTRSLFREMYNIDADYIFFCVARMDSDDEREAEHACASCGKKFIEKLSLSEVEVRSFGDDGFESPFDNEWRSVPFKLSKPITTLDVDGTPYSNGKLTLLTFGDFLDLIDSAKGKSNSMGTVQSMSVLKAISELGPDWKGTATLKDLDKISAKDQKMIERIYNSEKPGVVDRRTVVCSHCGAENLSLPVDWLTDFFVVSAA